MVLSSTDWLHEGAPSPGETLCLWASLTLLKCLETSQSINQEG